ncbi:DUF6083 domain-containing protein [Streptomyces chartreusis]|uniref:DUF6083 domain-containing protein n=1 Tax=Streptomyces chartreusis TaxID=1969 RepID=UPI002F9187C0|nr:DUF6083 domain-containing protein [Streptomyces chartreusis]WTA33605.1 DUF6083 domain-containing protein [Streptomyces chartreusis]
MSVPSQHEPDADLVPGWGRRLTVPCPQCGLATHRHRTLDFDGVNIYRPQAGPDSARILGDGEPAMEQAWIALVPGDYPTRFFADTEIYHLVGGIAWPGPHHRDYGSAKIAHDACCPGRHRSQPDTSQGAGELWRAMRLRQARNVRPGN